MQNFVGDRIAIPGRLPLGQQDTRERPVLRIHADDRGYRPGPLHQFAIERDLGGERHSQIGVDRNAQLLLGDEASLVGPAAPRIEREAGLDVRPAKAVGDDLVATTHQEITESFVGSPQIERRIAAGDRPEAAALAQQKSLEMQLGNVIPQRPALFGAAADDPDVVIGRKTVNVVSDGHLACLFDELQPREKDSQSLII